MFTGDRQIQRAQDVMCLGERVRCGMRVQWEKRLEIEVRSQHEGEPRMLLHPSESHDIHYCKQDLKSRAEGCAELVSPGAEGPGKPRSPPLPVQSM